MRICVDQGHGGEDPGAIGPTGLAEAAVAYKIGELVRDGLWDNGHEAWSTRDGDLTLSLQDRCDNANFNKADLLLSIHCNAFLNPAAHGYEVWTSYGETASDPIAESIFQSIGTAFPQLASRMDMTDGDSDKEAGFKVLTGTECAAVLVECAFISNYLEERWLRDAGWRMRMAGAIVSGIPASF